MVKTKNVIAALGVVAGFGVAALPLATYADATNPQTSNHVIRATVAEVFNFSVSPNTTITEGDITQTLAITSTTSNTTLEHVLETSGNAYNGFVVKMTSNNEYDSLRFVKNKNKTFGDPDRYDNSINIPAGEDVQAGTSSWAYRKSETPLTDQTQSIKGDYTGASWTKVKVKSTQNPDEIYSFANASHTDFDKKAYVNFGVAADEHQAAGVYEGEVIYTATASF